jgi:ribosomal protein L16 Arg81 hydroxylase
MLDLERQLERLFHPVSPRMFFARTWERTSLLIRGAPGKFDHLGFAFDVLQRIGRDPRESQICKAWRDTGREVAVDPGSIMRHYRAGRSLCMADVHLQHEPLRRVAAAMKASLGLAHKIGFACYVSPSRQGTGLHCDRHEVFILQIEGEKEWWYTRSPSVEFPVVGTHPSNPATSERFVEVHGAGTTRIPGRRDLIRTVLRPGDLLYVPAGAFHATRARDHSLSLTLGCVPRTIASIVGETIERAFRDDRAWRRNPPPARAANAGAAARIDALLDRRIRDLTRWLSSVDVGVFASTWRSHVADFAWDPPGFPQASEIAPDTRLMRVWPVAASPARRTGSIEVLAANRVFTVPRRHRRLVDGLVRHTRFTAAETRQWGQCSWATARAFVELMLHHGIVELT